MRKGLIIAGIIDLIICLTLIIFNVVVARFYLPLWYVIVIIADILLIIGAMNATPGLLLVWLIIGMMNIVFHFIAWIAWPAYALIHIFVAAVGCLHNTETGGDLFCMSDAELTAWFWLNLVFIIGLPIYYIYLWVVVKSHRENLVEAETAIEPMGGHQQGIFVLYKLPFARFCYI
jgi:hypothetical protein